MKTKATKQGTGVSPISGVAPPKANQFGGVNANPRNNGGLPKYVREVREELKGLLDPNLTMEDYRKIVEEEDTDSGLRGVFAQAVIDKDTKTVIQLIDQAWGKPKESIDLSNKDGTLSPVVRIIDSRISPDELLEK